MNLRELDARLRQLNDVEREFLELHNHAFSVSNDEKLKELFSCGQKNGGWIINSEKLMKPSEVLSVHRHDRFVRFEKHRHDFLEMTFVYSGTIRQTIEGKELDLKKGELVLLDMNVEHSIEESAENDIAINIMIRKEFFDWMFLSQFSSNDPIMSFIVKAIYGKGDIKQYLYFRTSKNDRVWEYMLHILTEYYEERNGRETAIRAYILLLFNELLRDYGKYLSDPMVCKIDSTISTELLGYIGSNYRELSLREMAGHFNYNPDYLSKLVKKVTGKKMTELVKEQRIKQAAYLLLHTDMPVAKIAGEVGFSNCTHFYRQFRDELKVTPDEYRKASIVSK